MSDEPNDAIPDWSTWHDQKWLDYFFPEDPEEDDQDEDEAEE